eukprot:COSAG05_NODE_1949_length_3794_cov_5.044182_4_plen_101_part_00
MEHCIVDDDHDDDEKQKKQQQQQQHEEEGEAVQTATDVTRWELPEVEQQLARAAEASYSNPSEVRRHHRHRPPYCPRYTRHSRAVHGGLRARSTGGADQI